MSSEKVVLESVKSKVKDLIQQHNALKARCLKLENEIENNRKLLVEKENEIINLKNISSEKNNLSGQEINVEELVKEIDDCIALLKNE